MGIFYEDSGCVDVYWTMGVEVDSRICWLKVLNAGEFECFGMKT